MIVEDNTDISENIGDYFEARGHILDFAMEGIGGLHLALTHDYDIIVLDIMMPGMDGLTFCRKLRTEGGKLTPVLMLTARDTLDDNFFFFDGVDVDFLVVRCQVDLDLTASTGCGAICHSVNCRKFIADNADIARNLTARICACSHEH